MKKSILSGLIGVLIFFLMAGAAIAVGTCTAVVTPSRVAWEIVWTWETDASGDVTLCTTDETISGWLNRFISDPDESDAPTAGFNIEIWDDHSADLLEGDGHGMSASEEESYATTQPYINGNQLQLIISGGGNAKNGVTKAIVIKP